MFYNSVSVSGWPIFTLLRCSITVWVCLGGLFLHCLICSITVGVSGWPIFSLLGCSITVWVCLGGLFFSLLGCSITCWSVTVAYFFIALDVL